MYRGKHRPDGRHILCGKCTLILPSTNQRKPRLGEQCEVCGDEGE